MDDDFLMGGFYGERLVAGPAATAQTEEANLVPLPMVSPFLPGVKGVRYSVSWGRPKGTLRLS